MLDWDIVHAIEDDAIWEGYSAIFSTAPKSVENRLIRQAVSRAAQAGDGKDTPHAIG